MPLPPGGVKVEIEFVAGTWTDVTADVVWSLGYTIRLGRTSSGGNPQISSVTFTLYNKTGNYTPGAQVQSDGVTATLYYPNVVQRKRVRISWNNGANVRFIGKISAWTGDPVNGFLYRSTVTAVDRQQTLSRVTMLPPLRQTIMVYHPDIYWPLTDAAGATSAGEASGNGGPALALGGIGPAPSFGATGPNTGDGTCVSFAPVSASSGQFLTLPTPYDLSGGGTWGLRMVVNIGNAMPAWGAMLIAKIAGLPRLSASASVSLDATGHVVLNTSALVGGGPLTGPSILDGGWHTIEVLNGTTLIVDGVSVGTVATKQIPTLYTLNVGGEASYTAGPFQGRIAQFAVFGANGQTADLNFVSARDNFGNETVSTRIRRFLTYAGLGSSDWNVDSSTVSCGTYPQAGKTVLTGCQDHAVTEGGGSVVYVLDGLVQFRNRTARKPPAAPRVNLCTNPNFETSTAGWSSRLGHCTIAQSNVQVHSGSFSGLVTSTGSSGGFHDGEQFTFATVVGRVYTVSAWVNLNAGCPAVLAFQVGGNGTNGTTVSTTGSFQQISVTITATATTSTVCFGPAFTASGQSYYLDDVLPEEGGEAGTYFDGSTAADSSYTYAWTGTANLSTSTASPVALTMTLDAINDLDGRTFAPSLDDQQLVNQVEVDRANANGTQSAQIVSNAASVAANDPATGSPVTTYTQLDSDALALAQSIVAAGGVPAHRLDKVAVDLVTATTDLYAAVDATSIGSRIRVVNLSVGWAAATQLDVIVEGWTETYLTGADGKKSYLIIFDTNSADNPPEGILDDTLRSRLDTDGATIASPGIDNVTQTVVIATTSGPTFTTNIADYPLRIQVEGERIILNAPPGGSTSPQTFSNCTRGADGTTPAAHATGAAVNVAFAFTLSL